MSSASGTELTETDIEKRRRDQGYPTCTATCVREYVIPLVYSGWRLGCPSGILSVGGSDE